MKALKQKNISLGVKYVTGNIVRFEFDVENPLAKKPDKRLAFAKVRWLVSMCLSSCFAFCLSYDIAGIEVVPLFVANSPLFVANSPLFVANSPLFVANSPLFVANSPLFVANSPLFVANSPLFVANSPLFVANSPLFVANSPLFVANSPLFVANSPLFVANSPFSSMHVLFLLLLLFANNYILTWHCVPWL